ncbi:class I SAM-dependent methyltransferase [Pseudodesulfovibrio portus]|uniref:Methyltransferase domain-containing protein n=1 Tax=Pseudodesulfovibrio portus TaxID=231439 RepID=A0ABM8ATC6_9BACT|nr:class I SAM-dependent methyltransferase [Pseudodesulfovibrio portus]BDQ34706.1 hypothetical protein JCM14722_22480 [Pseudodesulfovibrio portus]
MLHQRIQEIDARLNDVASAAAAEHASLFAPRELEFLERILAGGVAKYVDRLIAAGMADHRAVLDAGCGFGQWSIALCLLNTSVVAVDRHPGRTAFLSSVAGEFGLDNISVHTGDVTATGFDDAAFDAVFSYSVLPFAPWREAIDEYTRVLGKGGRLYVNANGLGWYAYLWREQHNKTDSYDPQAIAARALTNTLAYRNTGSGEPGHDIIIEPDELVSALQGRAYTDIEWGEEGTVTLPGKDKKPFACGSYNGMTAIYEILATRS